MTAEVAVFNRTAIALAADSAASIDGINSSKVFNNAEKLFALTKKHPVGVMIYGASQVNGIPWELIIKEYRKKYNQTDFKNLVGYANNFFSFTQDFYKKIHGELGDFDDTLSLQLSCISTISRVDEISKDFTEDDTSEDSTSKDEAFLRAATLLSDAISNIEIFEGFTEEDSPKISAEISAFVSSSLEDYDLSSDSDCYSSVLKLCCEQILKPDPFAPDFTGIVIAGYGEDEYFPRVYTYDIFGIVLDKLRRTLNERNSSIESSRAGLTAFAQKTEVESFMQGVCNSIDSKYYDQFDIYRDKIFEVFDSILELIPDKEIRKEKEKEITESEYSIYREIREKLYEYIQEEHVDKVVEMVEHLPKNELSYMAESLVNLTAFKRKVSNGQDSVGGPIDVAVISKGEGFVWIKRKHYFPGELNKSYKS